MPIFIPPERSRQIAALTIDIERIRNTIAHLTAQIDRLDERLLYLTRDRQRGVIRTALSILRGAGAPLTIRALTVAVMTEHGQDTADLGLVSRNIEKLRVSLTRQREAGVVRQERGTGRTPAMWEVVR
jgi:hypothetical protein